MSRDTDAESHAHPSEDRTDADAIPDIPEQPAAPAAGDEVVPEEEQYEQVNIQPSTTQYYCENKYPKSYRIQNDLRGHAIIFVMTIDREGWSKDLEALQSLFRVLNVSCPPEDQVRDPTRQVLEDKLSDFCKRDSHTSSDYAFIVFMGHGRGPHSVEIKLADDQYVDIYRQCVRCCTHPDSKLIYKPKTIIVQACRDNQEEINSPALQQWGAFHHYMFAYACQPGTKAARNIYTGCQFIQCLVEHMKRDTHRNSLSSMMFEVTRILSARTQHILRYPQKAQTWTGADHQFNFFPGITAEMSASIEQGVYFVANFGAYIGLTAGSLHILNEQNIKNKEDLMALSVSDIDSLGLIIGDKNKLKRGLQELEEANRTMVAQANTGQVIVLRTLINTIPDTADNTQRTEQQLYRDIQEKQDDLKQRLVTETARDVEIQTIEQGSIVIKLRLPDTETVKYLELLTETGFIDEILTEMFVTERVKEVCGVNIVELKTVIDRDKDTVPVTYHLEDQYAFEGEEIHIKSTIPVVGQKWFKECKVEPILADPLESQDNISILGEESTPELHIVKVTVKDAGMYWCQAHDQSVTLRCFVHIIAKAEVSDEELAASTSQIEVMEEEAPSEFMDTEDTEEMLKSMDTEDVILYLQESSTLRDDDTERIMKEPLLLRPRFLLDMVTEKGQTAILDLIEALEATEQTQIAQYVKTSTKSEIQMNVMYRDAIWDFKDIWWEEINLRKVIQQMELFGSLSHEEVSVIDEKPLYSQRDTFVDILQQKSDLDFVLFRKAMELTGARHLSERLSHENMYMRSEHARPLMLNRHIFIRTINLVDTPLLHLMLQRKIITKGQVEEIESCPDEEQQEDLLYDVVKRFGYFEWRRFMDILSRTEEDHRLFIEMKSGMSNILTDKEEAPYQVYCAIPRKKMIGFSVSRYECIYRIKLRIESECGMPVQEQMLIYGGRQLYDDRRLEDYNIQPESVLSVRVKQKLDIIILLSDNCYHFKVSRDDKISDIARDLENKTKIQPSEQQLTLDGRVLDTTKSWEENRVFHLSMMNLKLVKLLTYMFKHLVTDVEQPLQLNQNTSIIEAKKRLSQSLQKKGGLLLFYKGQELEDEHTLDHYNIQNLNTISFSSTNIIHVTMKVENTGEVITLAVNPSDETVELIREMGTILKLESKELTLTLNNKKLDEDLTLQENEVKDGVVIYVTYPGKIEEMSDEIEGVLKETKEATVTAYIMKRKLEQKSGIPAKQQRITDVFGREMANTDLIQTDIMHNLRLDTVTTFKKPSMEPPGQQSTV